MVPARWFLIWAFVICAGLRGDPAMEIARIHTAAIGGSERLKEWRGMRAHGVVRTTDQELDFELLAARPNRVRVVVRANGRGLLQATDGTAAWQQELGGEKPPRLLSAADTRAFNADAEFDDPLASPPERGYMLDYGGEVTWEGGVVLKVLVTRWAEEPSVVLVDPETYFIVARRTKVVSSTGVVTELETRYDDFRPVAGIILPHRVQMFSKERLLRETILNVVLPVMEPDAQVFVFPAASLADRAMRAESE